MSASVKTTCEKHGEHEWTGGVICRECLAVYDARDDKSPHYAPPLCTKCGKKLMPTGPDDTGDWTALPLCSVCFAEPLVKETN